MNVKEYKNMFIVIYTVVFDNSSAKRQIVFTNNPQSRLYYFIKFTYLAFLIIVCAMASIYNLQ